MQSVRRLGAGRDTAGQHGRNHILNCLHFLFDERIKPGRDKRRGNSDRQPHRRRQQSHPDSPGQNGWIDRSTCILQGLKGVDHAKHSAEQPKQRRNLTHRFNQPNAAAGTGNLATGGPVNILTDKLSLVRMIEHAAHGM